MAVSIRRANIHDLDVLVHLWMELAEFHAGFAPAFELAPDAAGHWREHCLGMLAEPTRRVLVAVDHGSVIGFITGSVRENPPVFREGWVGEISDAIVTAGSRRHGAGAQLVGELMQWFREREIKYIHLSAATANPLAVGFWHKMGFQDYMTRMQGELK